MGADPGRWMVDRLVVIARAVVANDPAGGVVVSADQVTVTRNGEVVAVGHGQDLGVRLPVADADEVIAAGDAIAWDQPTGPPGPGRWVILSCPTESTMRRFVTAALTTTRPAA